MKNNMKKISRKDLADIQNDQKPNFEIAINKVGVSELILPIFISQKVGGYQNSTAKISCSVDLAANLKGINMSRLPITIHDYIDRPLSGKLIEEIAEQVRINSEAETCELTYTFPYFIKKFAPESNIPGLVHHEVSFNGVKSKDNFRFRFSVETITTNLCPCSKEISVSGAHNQRCHIKVMCQQKPGEWIWIEDIIQLAENSSSCEIFSVLKREDEKYVTEKAYENPMFVEDVVRSCYDKLSKMTKLAAFRVEATAMESIHLHNAKATMESKCKNGN